MDLIEFVVGIAERLITADAAHELSDRLSLASDRRASSGMPTAHSECAYFLSRTLAEIIAPKSRNPTEGKEAETLAGNSKAVRRS